MSNDIKRPMFCRNVDSFPVRQILGTRCVLVCSTSHAEFTENFGMTFAKKWTNREPEICRNGNESTLRQNIGHSASFPGNNKRPLGHNRTTSIMEYANEHQWHTPSDPFLFAYNFFPFFPDCSARWSRFVDLSWYAPNLSLVSSSQPPIVPHMQRRMRA